jgi:hypothetical protein
MTSYFVDVRFERQLDDDLPIVGLTDEQAKNGKILGGHLVRQFVGELQESYNYGGLARHFEVERVVLSSGDDIWRHGDPLPPYTLEEAVIELVPELDKVKANLPAEVRFRLAKVLAMLPTPPAAPQTETPPGETEPVVDLSPIGRIPAPSLAA